MSTDYEEPHMLRPATKGEIGFVAADTVLALRSIHLALLALQLENQTLFKEQLDEIEKHTDALWKRFQGAMGRDDE